MKIILDESIKQIKGIQKKFNTSKNATERYALLQAYNHIIEIEMPIHGWMEKSLREGMLRSKGVKI